MECSRENTQTPTHVHTHIHTVNTHGLSAWLIHSYVSAGIFYSRGKWAVTDITAAHTL